MDPLFCTRSGQKVQVIALLDHLGRSTTPHGTRPTDREILRVASHAEDWAVPTEWE